MSVAVQESTVMPLVSVIVPCYNAEAFVGEAIESALTQTYSNTDVIVIDDGSTDGTLEVIRSFGERIRWESGPNRGACAARNRGLSLARGEWIQFLDADDLLHREKLERQVPIALEHAPAIVYCDREVRFADDPARLDVEAPSLIHDPVEFALVKIISVSAPLYPHRIFHEMGDFREDLSCAQDYELNLRFAVRGLRFYHLHQPLLTIRRQSVSISSDSTKVLDQFRVLWWATYRELEKGGGMSERRRRVLAGRMAGAGRAYLRHGRREKSRICFREASAMHPGGGIDFAYSRWTRVLRLLVGPRLTEAVVMARRRIGVAAR